MRKTIVAELYRSDTDNSGGIGTLSSVEEESTEHRSAPEVNLGHEQVPKEYHHAAAVLCLLKSANRKTRLRHLFFTTIIAYMQLIVASVLFFSFGNVLMPCVSSDECGGGKWCSASQFQKDTGDFSITTRKCLECDAAPTRCDLDGMPIDRDRPWTFAELEAVYAPLADLTAVDADAMCASCVVTLTKGSFFILSEVPITNVPDVVDPADNSTRPSWLTHPMLNVVLMTWRQWCAFLLVSMVVALNIAKESRDRARTLLFLNSKSWYTNQERRLRWSLLPANDDELAQEAALVVGAGRTWGAPPVQSPRLQRADSSTVSNVDDEDFRKDEGERHFSMLGPFRRNRSKSERGVAVASLDVEMESAAPPHAAGVVAEDADGAAQSAAKEPSTSDAQPPSAAAPSAAAPPAAAPSAAAPSATAPSAAAPSTTVRFSADTPEPLYTAPYGPYNISCWEWELYRLLLLNVQNVRVLMVAFTLGCLPAFIMYDETPVVINILLDAMAILFVLDVADLIYRVILHDTLTSALESEPRQLRLSQSSKAKVHQIGILQFKFAWAIVILPLLLFYVCPINSVNGAYVGLGVLLTQFVVSLINQVHLLASDTYSDLNRGEAETYNAFWRAICCGFHKPAIPPRFARFIVAWLITTLTALTLFIALVFGWA